MKQYWKISFTCISLALALTLAGCGTALEKSTNLVIGEGSGTGELVSQEKQSFKSDQFNSVDIVADAMEIIVNRGDGDEATVELLKDSEISSELSFDASIQGDKLQVTVSTKEKLFSLNDQQRGERKLIVTLPDGHETSLEIENDFGKVELSDITVSNASVRLDAGNIVSSGVAGELDLKVEAGNINVKQATGDYQIITSAETGNIDINFDKAPAKAQFELQVDVGKVKLGIDDVNYEENRNTVIKANRGIDGQLIKATVSVGAINVN